MKSPLVRVILITPRQLALQLRGQQYRRVLYQHLTNPQLVRYPNTKYSLGEPGRDAQ